MLHRNLLWQPRHWHWHCQCCQSRWVRDFPRTKKTKKKNSPWRRLPVSKHGERKVTGSPTRSLRRVYHLTPERSLATSSWLKPERVLAILYNLKKLPVPVPVASEGTRSMVAERTRICSVLFDCKIQVAIYWRHTPSWYRITVLVTALSLFHWHSLRIVDN